LFFIFFVVIDMIVPSPVLSVIILFRCCYLDATQTMIAAHAGVSHAASHDGADDETERVAIASMRFAAAGLPPRAWSLAAAAAGGDCERTLLQCGLAPQGALRLME
jgi:hypothetical protein